MRDKMNLLIVDDEKLVRWSIQESMGKDKFNVVSASDGTEAIEKIKQKHFDVIITDFVMPDCDGIEVAKKTMELQPSTKIIMMTAYDSLLDKEEAKRAGVTTFINKPFQVNEVRSAVSKILSKQ